MEQGNRAEYPLGPLRARGKPCRRLRRVRDEVAVGEHRAFRGSRGAARVLQHRDVIGAAPRVLARFRRRRGEVRESMDAFVAWDHEGPVPLLLQVPPLLDRVQLAQRGLEELGDVADDDAFHADLRHGLRDAVPEQVERHDRVHARIAPEDRKLPRRVRGVRLDDDPSRAEDREKGDDEMRRVREHEGNAVSTANPNRSQTGGEPVDCGVEFAVRKGFPVESDRRSDRELLRGSPEQLPDRDVRIGERGWHALGPAAEPRPREGRLPLHARDNAAQDQKGTGGPNDYALQEPMEARCPRRRASESTERKLSRSCGSTIRREIF